MSKKSKRVSLITAKIKTLEMELSQEKYNLSGCHAEIARHERDQKIHSNDSSDIIEMEVCTAFLSSEKQNKKQILAQIDNINVELKAAHQQLQTIEDEQAEKESNLMIMRLREKELELEILKLKSQNPTPESLDQIISELKGE